MSSQLPFPLIRWSLTGNYDYCVATRHRLLLEELEQWVDWLGGDEPRESVVVEEQALLYDCWPQP
jgi:hypothetical protein